MSHKVTHQSALGAAMSPTKYFKIMNHIIVSIFIALLTTPSMFAQKVVTALRSEEPVKIDGIFNEEIWQSQNDIATDFISIAPNPNQVPRHQTEVRLIYDDEAIYVAAHMIDASADSVMKELSLRDNFGQNVDFFGIIIDAYGNGTSGVEFMLSSRGVQLDNKLSANNGDSSWDAVWFGETRIDENGWYAEMKIPYAALRFPKKDIQSWKVNFFRKRVVDGTFHSWNNVDFEEDNAWLNQLGKLEGIKDIKPPLRLTLTPYASIYAIQSKDPSRNPTNTSAMSYNYGMDVKLGLNDAYTLDMTLIPDFGQTRSDDQVLNLSPFEVRFSENRAFFTEGLELFNKSGIFYSRRIGQDQQLYNATKVTGRNDKGTAIAVFNAVAKEESHFQFDEVLNEDQKVVVKPLTNYNILVFDQDLKNNSSISLTNTNVTRNGSQFNNANVTAATYSLKNKKQSYGVSGKFAVSQIINKTADNSVGHVINVGFDKLNGSAVFGIKYEEISKSYNHNDLGFFTRGNQRYINAYFTKRDFDGFGIFNRFNYWANTSYTRNIDPDSYSEAYFNVGMFAQTKSFFQFNLWASAAPKRKNFFEARTPGRHFNQASNFGGGFWFTTDNRKKFQFQSYGNIFNNDRENHWINSSLGSTLNYRASNKVSFIFDLSISKETNAQGYVTHSDDHIIFGSRDVRSLQNRINIKYTVNNKMGFDVRLRHFWSSVDYDRFYNLNEDGSLSSNSFAEFKDFSFNAFTIDANYRWRFAPGSELIVVWKNNISGVLADPSLDYGEMNYRDGVSGLGSLPQTNSISLRFSYFLDYNTHLKKLIK